VPWIGRWASCDPNGLSDGPNLYVYVQNNPTRMTDPNGRQSDDDLHDVGVSHHTPEQAAAARAASASAQSPTPQTNSAAPSEDDDEWLGRSTKPGPRSDFLVNPPHLRLGSDVQLQNLGPTQNAFVPRSIQPYATLEATGSGLLQSPTDPSQGWTGQVGGGLHARFTLNPNTEVGIGGTYGRSFTLGGQPLSGPPNVGTAFGSVHFSEAQPPNADKVDTRGAGFFGIAGAAFGAGPKGETSWYASGAGAYSWSWPDGRSFLHLQGVDLNAGVAGAGLSQINGVNVRNVVTPFASVNLGLPHQLNFEVYGGVPIAGGNLSDPLNTRTPVAGRLGAGFGIQIPLGNIAIGAEIGVTGEFSNVRVPNQPNAPYNNVTPWLNIGVGAVNRRVDFGNESAFPARY
jgi:hypothetical protein